MGTIVNIKKPSWLQSPGMTEQMTVIPKNRFLGAPNDMRKAAVKEAKQSGRPAVAAMLNAGEEVVPAPVVDDLGGSEGVTQAINSALPPGRRLNPATDKGTVGAYAKGTMGIRGRIKGFATGTIGATEEDPEAGYVPPASKLAPPKYNPNEFGENTVTTPPASVVKAGIAGAAASSRVPTTTGLAKTAATKTVAAPVLQAPSAVAAAPQLSVKAPVAQAAPALQTPAAVAAPQARTIAVQTPEAAGALPDLEVKAPVTPGELPSPRPTGIAGAAKKAGLVESPAAEASRLATMEGLQQTQAAEQIAASQRAAQAGQTGAAYAAAMGQLQASQEGALGTASRDTAIANAQAAEGKLAEAASMALSAGDYSSVNSLLTQAGLPAVDFGKIEKKEREANLKAASDDLIDIAERFTEDNPTLAGVLMDRAFALRGEMYSSIAGVDFDPASLAGAMSAIDNDDYTNPQLQALVGKVAPGILDWFSTAEGQSSTYALINSPQASAVFKKIADGTATEAEVTQLGTVMALMFDNKNGVNMSDSDMALLSQWGVWKDVTKPTASVRPVDSTGQEPEPATAPVIPNIPVSSRPGVQAYTPAAAAPVDLAPVVPVTPQAPAGIDLSGATELTPAQYATLTNPQKLQYIQAREDKRLEDQRAADIAAHPEVAAFNVAPFTVKGINWGDGSVVGRNPDGSSNITSDQATHEDMGDEAWNWLGYSSGSFDFEHQTGTKGFLQFGPGKLHARWAVDEDFYGINTTADSDHTYTGSGQAADGQKIMNRATLTKGMQSKVEKMAKDGTTFQMGGNTYTVDTVQPIIRDILVGTTSRTSGSGAVGSQNWYADGIVVTDQNGFSKVITFPVYASMWDNNGDKGDEGQYINLGITVWDPDNITTQMDQV